MDFVQLMRDLFSDPLFIAALAITCSAVYYLGRLNRIQKGYVHKYDGALEVQALILEELKKANLLLAPIAEHEEK